jgi:phenylpropionate dioxygenase-like ring-hydroxylating dioxygenase large terminal subunit
MKAKTILGEPILIGRDSQGVAFAMRDICPHQAVPLSKGWFDGKEVTCPFHAWSFDTAGTCTKIPSLCEGQQFNVCSIRTKSYPCRQVNDCIWVYFGEKTENLPEVPTAPGLEGLSWDCTSTTLLLPTHIDYAAAALIDPAHVPYVHNSWWWRSHRNPKLKEKRYIPDGTGWTMVRHKPSKSALVFRYFGDHFETEIGFRLPGCRIEQLIFRGRTILSGISALTPIDDTHTELTHTTYWTVPGFAPLVRPVINYFVHEFLGQDQHIAKMQEPCLKLKTPLVMTIPDAGTPGRWYFQLKKEWADCHAKRRPFKNPVPDTVLRWMT